jgi:competence protein CoiA
MLTSIRQLDDKKVYASDMVKGDASFQCPACKYETILRKGKIKIPHFAHKSSASCEHGRGESDAHRKCKQSIYDILKISSGVTNCELEKDFGKVISDVFFIFNGKKIAIEVQISNLSESRIIERTEAYNDLGIYVLWMPLYENKFNGEFYSPKPWEKWLHTAYLSRVYYWVEELSVISIHFSPRLIIVPSTQYGGGYQKKSKRDVIPNLSSAINILNDFKFVDIRAGEYGNICVPDRKILIDNQDPWWKQ